jgi:hypothetical protein
MASILPDGYAEAGVAGLVLDRGADLVLLKMEWISSLFSEKTWEALHV